MPLKGMPCPTSLMLGVNLIDECPISVGAEGAAGSLKSLFRAYLCFMGSESCLSHTINILLFFVCFTNPEKRPTTKLQQ